MKTKETPLQHSFALRQLRLFFVLLGSFGLLCAPLAAEEESPILLFGNEGFGLISFAKLEIVADVDEGCWFGRAALESQVKLELERTDIAVYEHGNRTATSPLIHIEVLATKLSGNYCTASVNFRVSYPSVTELYGEQYDQVAVSYAGEVMLVSRNSLVTGRAPLDARISLSIDEYLADLLVDVVVARRNPTIVDLFEREPQLLLHPHER